MNKYSRYTLITALLVIGVLVSGCLNMNFKTTVNEDGSGTWQMKFGFDASIMAMMGEEENPFADFEAVEQTDEETGITVSSFLEEDEDGATWVVLQIEVPDQESWALLPEAMERVDTLSSDMMGEDMGSEDVGEVMPMENILLFPVVEIEDGTYHVTIDLGIPAEMMASDEEDMSAEEMDFGMSPADIFNMTFELELPGELVSHNADFLDGDTGNPIWVIDFTSEDPLVIEATSELK